MSFLNFIQYHNAVPIAVSILVLGGASAFAATNPEAIYSQDQQVVSIDNTYLVGKNLSTYTPKAIITAVTEDADNYYVAYTFYTIDLQDAVWQDVQKSETMTVSKADLGPYRDLGVYVTEQLHQQVTREKENLAQVQEIERKNVTQKTVATTYGGIVGKLLTDTTETLPGYTPVVKAPPPVEVAAAATPSSTTNSSDSPAPTNTPQTSGPSGNPSLTIQLLGNNPAQIPIGSSYVDLGGIVTDAANDNIGIHTFLNGTEVQQIQLNTSATSTWTITYKATDPQGNTVTAERKVYVYDPAVGPPLGDTPVSAPAVVPVTTPSTPSTPSTPTQTDTSSGSSSSGSSTSNTGSTATTTVSGSSGTNTGSTTTSTSTAATSTSTTSNTSTNTSTSSASTATNASTTPTTSASSTTTTSSDTSTSQSTTTPATTTTTDTTTTSSTSTTATSSASSTPVTSATSTTP